MKYLYLLLDIGSFSIPFIFSFHPKLKFYRYWKSLALGTFITMTVFIPWDILFTINNIWSFNEDYFIGIKIFSMPLEEWLFFILIPYACIFMHYALFELFPKIELQRKSSNVITNVLIIVFALIAISNYDKWYTLVNFSYATILLLLVKTFSPEVLKNYFLTFPVMLIPFFIINGILTGSFIDDQVVWYNNNENLNIRLFTIPIEDTVYAFSMILTNLAITQFFYRKLNSIKFFYLQN